MKLYTTEMQVCDDDLQVVAAITADGDCAIVRLTYAVHDKNSWDELSRAIKQAIIEVCKE